MRSGLRIAVWDILGWPGAGIAEAQILDEHPGFDHPDTQRSMSNLGMTVAKSQRQPFCRVQRKGMIGTQHPAKNVQIFAKECLSLRVAAGL